MKKTVKGGLLIKRRAFWKDTLVNYKQSGLGQKEFCLENDVKLERFRYWYYKLREELGNELESGSLKLPMGFLELKLPEDSGDKLNHPQRAIQESLLEVEIDNRFRVKLSRNFDEEILLRLVKAVSL